MATLPTHGITLWAVPRFQRPDYPSLTREAPARDSLSRRTAPRPVTGENATTAEMPADGRVPATAG